MPKKSKTTSSSSNPASTGGAGTVFEQHVGAYWLALLLLRGVPPVLCDGTVVGVHFQTEHFGWHTDDFLIDCELELGGRCKLIGQVKRTLTISAANKGFSQLIRDGWADFRNIVAFSPTKDQIVIVVLRGTDTLLKHFAGLLDCSRAAGSCEDFLERLRCPGFIHSKSLNYYEEIYAVIADAEGGAVAPTDVWSFIRVLHLMSLDLTTSTGQVEAQIKTSLAQCAHVPNAVGTVQATWDALVSEAGTGISCARSYVRDALPEPLRNRHVPINQHGHQSLVPPNSKTNFMGTIPLHNPKLIGRTAILEEVASLLSGFAMRPSIASHNVVAIHGMAGIGKTTLAVALAYAPTVTSAFADGIFWQSMGKKADPLAIVSGWCDRIGVPQLVDGQRGISDLLARTREAKVVGDRLRAFLSRAGKRFLFILDDVWNQASIEPLLIAGGSCASLFTTRILPIVEEFAPHGQSANLSRLNDEESLAALSGLVGSEMVAKHKVEFDELVGRLDGLPLALTVTGGLLVRANNRGHSVSELIRQLRERTDILLSEPVPADVRQFLNDVENPNIVAILQLSTDELDYGTRRYFAVLGESVPPNEGTFSLKWMARGWGITTDEAREIADTLVEANLIQPAKRVAGEAYYYMHDLLIQHAKTMIATQGE